MKTQGSIEYVKHYLIMQKILSNFSNENWKQVRKNDSKTFVDLCDVIWCSVGRWPSFESGILRFQN